MIILQRRPTYKVSFWGGGVPLDLRFRGSLEAKSFVRAPTIDPPGAPGRVFDLKCASCGHVRRCNTKKGLFLLLLDFGHESVLAQQGPLLMLRAVSGPW